MPYRLKKKIQGFVSSKVSVHQLQETGKVKVFYWAFLPLLPLPPSQSVFSRAEHKWMSEQQEPELRHGPRGQTGEAEVTERLPEIKQGMKVQSLAPE